MTTFSLNALISDLHLPPNNKVIWIFCLAIYARLYNKSLILFCIDIIKLLYYNIYETDSCYYVDYTIVLKGELKTNLSKVGWAKSEA